MIESCSIFLPPSPYTIAPSFELSQCTIHLANHWHPMKVGQSANINGKMIYSAKAETNRLDLSQLSSGLYYVRVETSAEMQVQKFIKQ